MSSNTDGPGKSPASVSALRSDRATFKDLGRRAGATEICSLTANMPPASAQNFDSRASFKKQARAGVLQPMPTTDGAAGAAAAAGA
eukprot:CAMPEP_0183454094 /NCGR_PEP_ID=MMETSP0370-20130417/122981_1 /TAXON_ID=268820 /ORGANISM="Peridinium aciculiferum, Strain PAER-2" /LENGTH=85 /DNA_ID=CAMNT_0025645565 /DNA_START=27 /DNA_END=281 /DNA_ORIENTATION=-